MTDQWPDLPPFFKEFISAQFKSLNDKIDALAQVLAGHREEQANTNQSCVVRCRNEMNEVYDRLRGAEGQVGIHEMKINSVEKRLHVIDGERVTEKTTIATEKAQWFQGYTGLIIAVGTVVGVLLNLYNILKSQ